MNVVYALGYPQSLHGSQRSLLRIVEHLPCSITPIVFFPCDGRAPDAYRRSGLSVKVVATPGFVTHYGSCAWSAPGPRRLLALSKDIPPFLFRTVCALIESQAHLLHCNDPRSLVLFAPAAKLLGIPVLWHVRGRTPDSNIISIIANRCVSHAIVVARQLIDEVPRSVPTSVVYNSVDVAQWDESIGGSLDNAECRRQGGSERSDPSASLIILTASSPTPYKGLHHAIEAVNIIYTRWTIEDDVQLLIAGEPESDVQHKYLRKLRSLVEDRGLEQKVRFIGWHDDIPDMLAQVDLTLLPTVEYENVHLPGGELVEAQCREGLPRVVLESMAAGVPVIASDVAGVRELVDHRQNGLLVTPGSAVELAWWIQCLWSDSEWRRLLGCEGKKKAGLFSDQRTLLGTILVYRHVYGTYGGQGSDEAHGTRRLGSAPSPSNAKVGDFITPHRLRGRWWKRVWGTRRQA